MMVLVPILLVECVLAKRVTMVLRSLNWVVWVAVFMAEERVEVSKKRRLR